VSFCVSAVDRLGTARGSATRRAASRPCNLRSHLLELHRAKVHRSAGCVERSSQSSVDRCKEDNSLTAMRARATHRGQYRLASHRVRGTIVSPQRGQFKMGPTTEASGSTGSRTRSASPDFWFCVSGPIAVISVLGGVNRRHPFCVILDARRLDPVGTGRFAWLLPRGSGDAALLSSASTGSNRPYVGDAGMLRRSARLGRPMEEPGHHLADHLRGRARMYDRPHR